MTQDIIVKQKIAAGGAFPVSHDMSDVGQPEYVQSGMRTVDNFPAWFDLPTALGLAEMFQPEYPDMGDINGLIRNLETWEPQLYPRQVGEEWEMVGRRKDAVRTASGVSTVYTDVMQLSKKDGCDGEYLTTIGRGPAVGKHAALRPDVGDPSSVSVTT